MKKRITLLITLFIAFFSVAFAQNITVKGTVKDDKGLTLPGATVKVKGTSTAVATNINGQFTISAPSNGTLVFSSISYVTQEQPINGRTTINITLASDQKTLSEVVVIGYGTRAVKDVTGAIASVKAEKLENENPTSVTDIIRGNVPGISVAMNTSAKGGGAGDLQIRGKASLSGNSNPLIVLDGVIYFGQLADINPDDIERVDVLKDPSALAVYGAQAAGGVVAITTKKGRAGKPTISITANGGIAQLAKNQKVYQGEDFLNWRADVARSTNTNNPYYYYSNPNNLPSGVTLTQFMNGATGDPTTVWLQRLGLFANEISNYQNGKTIDWGKEVFRNGIRQDYTASLQGRSDAVSYYMSGNYTNNQNLIKGGHYTDGRVRVNLEGKATKFLTIGINSQFASRDEGAASDALSGQGIDRTEADWTQVVAGSPYGDFYNADGTIRRIDTDDSGLNFRNPFLGNAYNSNVAVQNVLFANMFARVELPFGFKYSLNYSPQIEAYRNFFFRPVANPNELAGGTGIRTMENRYRFNLDNVINWNKTFGIHNFDATFLLNKEQYHSWYTRTDNSQFSPSDILGYHNIGAGTLPVESSDDRVYNADALMARLNYNLLGRYILTGTIRRDGFSPFGLTQPRQTYTSGALAWVFTDEKFMKGDGFKWLNYGKLRVSYGSNGNRLSTGTADPSLALALLNLSRYPTATAAGVVTNNTGIYATSLQNPNLTWEKTTGTNFGLDFTMFNNRLNGSVDVYPTRKTTNLIVRRALLWVQGLNTGNNIQIGGSSNNSNLYSNIGEVTNKGFEVALDGKIIQSKNFNWSAAGTFSLNRNKIVHLYGEYQVKDANGNMVTRENDDIGNGWFIGHDVNAVWDYKILGVWQQSDAAEIARINAKTNVGIRPGDFKLQDVNGDDRWDNADKQFLGSESPKFNWSLRNDFNFLRNFNASFLLVSSIGQLRQYNQALNNPGSVGYLRMNSYVQPYWTPDNPINDYARLVSGQSGTTINVWRKSSFVRLQTVSLGYNIPKDIVKHFGMSNAKIYVNATNPYVFTGWNYWDPQNNGPTPRFWQAGFSATF
ncbi:SusC/RagA family TonB-linked outer membrane protein [Mucilaginibacter sp. RS28]|uniref:SusC/RagA family TonB-linked outer membrane protein n=1 Tax=Mucilaginibacter straminoryzae TaxID=2932774 RepID=A0A9X1X4P8_9SPHI|nr:SusC/RagA family TonB-linked outer membrane protein [Mucilaginibacter straminoryzae]MCJ8211062.1 SusC/RagA family TonB-linked outer membrane protein [Mucilaginibacter straminoryzae]